MGIEGAHSGWRGRFGPLKNGMVGVWQFMTRAQAA